MREDTSVTRAATYKAAGDAPRGQWGRLAAPPPRAGLTRGQSQGAPSSPGSAPQAWAVSQLALYRGLSRQLLPLDEHPGKAGRALPPRAGAFRVCPLPGPTVSVKGWGGLCWSGRSHLQEPRLLSVLLHEPLAADPGPDPPNARSSKSSRVSQRRGRRQRFKEASLQATRGQPD